LRYYERSGLIRSRGRSGGRRQYEPAVIQRLAVIALLQEVGFSIREIKTLVGRRDGHKRWRPLAERKLKEIDEHIQEVKEARDLLTAALACDCSGLDTCDLIRARTGRHRKVVQRLGSQTVT
jgi:MerR family transcriptional regulator, redox-sensitive transcriptional activator SoxR